MRTVLSAIVTDSPEFRRWFGQSRVVDRAGNPLPVYHGSRDQITEFRPNDYSRVVAWFATDTRLLQDKGYGPVVMTAYLSIQNPLIITGFDMDGKLSPVDAYRRAGLEPVVQPDRRRDDVYRIVNHSTFVDAAKAAGRDGIAIRENGVWTWAPFSADQVLLSA